MVHTSLEHIRAIPDVTKNARRLTVCTTNSAAVYSHLYVLNNQWYYLSHDITNFEPV